MSNHTMQVKDRAIELYFQIEQHILTGGAPLSLKDVNRLLGLSSSASSQMYLDILQEWGLINRIPFVTRTITLANKGFPFVEYRKDERWSNDHEPK